MESPPLAQKLFYGDAGGPPMLFEEPRSKPPPRSGKRRKLVPPKNPSTMEAVQKMRERSIFLASNENELSPSDLPGDFPQEFAFRSLAIYSLLRTLSVKLRLSPFTPNAFLRALYLPFPSKLSGQVHVALLRALLPELGYTYRARGKNFHKRRLLDNVRWPLRGGDNLTYLDGFSWPLFYDDYCHLTADILWAKYNDETSYVDMRNLDLDPSSIQDYQHSSLAFGYKGDGVSDDESESLSSDDNNGNEESLEQLLAAQRPTVEDIELERGNRAGRNRAYFGMHQLNSGSSFGENDVVEDEDSDFEYIHAASSSLRNQVPAHPVPSSQISGNFQDTSGLKVQLGEGDTSKDSQIGNKAPTGAPVMHIRGGGDGPSFTSNGSLPIANRDLQDERCGEVVSQPETSLQNQHESDDKEICSSAEPTIAIGSKSSTINLDDNAVRPTTTEVKSVSAASLTPSGDIKDFSAVKISSFSRGNVHSRRKLPLSKSISVKSVESNTLRRPTITTHTSNSATKESAYVPQNPTMNDSKKGPIEMQMMAMYSNHAVSHYRPLKPNSTRGEDPVSAAKTPQRKPRRRQLQVEDHLAKILSDVICGKEVEPLANADPDSSKSSSKFTSEFQEKMENERWAHFDPLEAMRSGVPHFSLSLEQKIFILEFLTDQLLSVAEITAELQKRKTIESCYKVPYGVWPSKEQFEVLDNADECGVCQGEGELLCCDGCVRSYHRSCLAMNALEELPEGKWLCPECRLVDPSLFGPLRAGAKSILEWFSISDLQSSLLEEETRLAVRQPPYEHDAIDTFADPTYKELTGSEMTSDSPDMTTRNTAFTAPDPCPGQEFMVAHGYLFCRQLDEARSSSSSVSLLSRPVTLSVLEKLDPAIRNAWPLVQIPTQETVSSPHFPTAKTYLLPLEAYDPSFYKNKYRSAPVPLMLRAGGSTQALKLMAADFESECCQNSTYRLSDALSRDFRLDTAVNKSLLSETALHDPYAVFRGYLLKLEGQIRKAHLVDEFWEAGTDESRQGRWLKAVRSAKSIQRLARLLLQLVDDMHPRAFDSGWFQNHQCKGDEVITDVSKNLVDLPSDWTKEKESRKRIWERVTPDAILHVCETQKCSLDGFVQGIKEHISPLLVAKRSKRKRLKEKVSTAFSDKGKMNVGNQLKEETMPTNMDPTSESMVTTGLQRTVAEPPTALNTHVIAEKVSTLESAWSASNPLGQKQGGPSGVALVGQDISATHAQSGNNGEVTATVNHDSTENENRQAQDKQIIVERKEQELSKPHEAVQTSESISPDTEATTADRATCDSSAKIPACNGDKNGPTRNDRKKRSLSATPTTTRRRTRRSVGRMAVAAGDNDLQGEVAPIGLTSKTILTSFDSIEMHIELQKMSKIPQVEKIVKGGFQRQLEWPVAGRLPFATVGNLPPQEVRRLARNAGVVKAPYVAYQTAHEVGQVCFAHSWRKDTEQCKSYEELAFQIRVLESFIDHQTVQSCESIARRGKNQIQKIVKLVQRDQSNGVPEYFVVSKTKNKGAWVSSKHIEVSALTLHNFTRRQRHIERREMYLKAKAQKKAAEEARQKRQNEAARHARAAEEAVKRSKENEERRLKAAEKAASQRQEKSRATAQQIQHASKHATLTAQLQQMTPETRKWTEISNAIIMQHQLDLSKLAKQCQDAGLPILEDRQTQLRQSTLMRLKGIGFLKVPDEKLVEIMLLSEKAALRGMSTIEASRTLANPTTSNSMQSSNSQNFGNMNNSYGNPRRPVGDIAAGSGGVPHGLFEPPRQVQPSQPPNNVWNNAMPQFLGALMPIQNAGAPVPQNGYGNNSYGGNTGRGHHGVPPSQNFSQQLPNVLPQFQPHLSTGSLVYQQNMQGVFQLPGNSQTGGQQYQGSNPPTSDNQYQGSNHPTSGNQYQGSNPPISGNHQEDLQQQIQRLQLLQMHQQQQQRHHGQQQFGGPSNNGFW